MNKKIKLKDNRVKIALIGFASTVIAALIGGFFGYVNTRDKINIVPPTANSRDTLVQKSNERKQPTNDKPKEKLQIAKHNIPNKEIESETKNKSQKPSPTFSLSIDKNYAPVYQGTNYVTTTNPTIVNKDPTIK